MRIKAKLLCLIPAIALLSGCSFVHDEHLVGHYCLNAVDVDEQMCVAYELPDGSAVGRISETVFSVGWDDRYIVAKQHPDNKRSVTDFYYLEMAKDSAYADPRVSVTGPLTAGEFARKQAELGLPAFRRTIKSLQ